MGWPWLSLRPMLGDTDMAALTDTGTDTMARGPLTPAPMLGVTDMAAPTAMVTDTDTDTDMARGPLMPMPGDTDTAAHTDTDTATGTDTLMASKLPPNLVACHRTPMSSKYLSHSC